MTVAHKSDTNIVRCNGCGGWLQSASSACTTCHIIAIRNESRDWQANAVCRTIDPELWFPEAGTHTPKIVKESCSKCPVRRNCLRVGLHEQYGIWAGFTQTERIELRRRVVGLSPEARDAIVEIAADEGSSFLSRTKK